MVLRDQITGTLESDAAIRAGRSSNVVTDQSNSDIGLRNAFGERLATMEERLKHLPTHSELQWLIIGTAAASIVVMVTFFFSMKSLGIDAFDSGFTTSQAIAARDATRDQEMAELRSLISSVASSVNKIKKSNPPSP